MSRHPSLEICDLAIIGGGFSGASLTAQLARQAPAGFSLVLFEPAEVGRGAAYGTAHEAHLLNTRARQMSVFPDEPDHFVRWLGDRAQADDFVPRRLYGTYVNECARRALERPGFMHVPERVVKVTRSDDRTFVVETSAGACTARSVVLATGNPPPNDSFLPLEMRIHPGFISDPWRFDYRRVGGHVLVIGSGLTALDVLVALDACGHRGRVDIVSRRGRYPETHARVAAYDVIPALDTHSARSLLRSFRRHVKDAARRGFDWRAVVDAVRPEAEAIWKRVPVTEQRRFEKHLRTHWERHRHRAPQQVVAVRERYRRSKRLATHAGQIAGMRDGIVTLALRDGAYARVRPDWIVNCTGLAGAAALAKDPLIADLLAGGLISASPGGLGLHTNARLAAFGATHLPTPGLWIVGPPVRGSRFEATAVPELRSMAELAADQILAAHAGVSRSILVVNATTQGQW
ncbi:MAG TPA: FAD/NAD(P)-binding protein [Candidatus Cybelea sp.]